MACARTVLLAVVVIVALGVAAILTLTYPNPNVAKLIGWFLLFVGVQIPVVMFASAGRHGSIRIVDRDAA